MKNSMFSNDKANRNIMTLVLAIVMIATFVAIQMTTTVASSSNSQLLAGGSGINPVRR